MAGRIETGAADDAIDLAAEVRNAARRLRIGCRGEQSSEAMLAEKPASAIEPLDADIVEMGAPMHARARARFGDDQKRLLLQKGADRRRDSYGSVPVLQQPHAGIAQQPETRLDDRCEDFIVGKDVIPCAKKCKIPLGHPFEKRARFADLLATQ